jgi:hypothetical protein
MKFLSKIFICLTLISILFSCKSDDEIKKDANEFVNKFVNELLLENYDYVEKVYPDFKGYKYWIPKEFTISETIIEPDGSITIYGDYRRMINRKDQLKFNLIEENGVFKIKNTKGLFSYFNSALNDYCIKKGYYNNSKDKLSMDNDVDVAKVCMANEFKFDLLINKCIQYVYSHVDVNKQQCNFGYNLYSTYLSGDIQIQNNTAFNLDVGQFRYYLNLISHNKTCKTESLADFSFIHINPFSSYNYTANYVENTCNSTQYRIQLEIYNRELFAKEVVNNLSYAESL